MRAIDGATASYAPFYRELGAEFRYKSTIDVFGSRAAFSWCIDRKAAQQIGADKLIAVTIA